MNGGVKMKCMKCGATIPENSVYCNICGKKQIREKQKRAKRPNGAGTAYKVSGTRRKPWAAVRYKKLVGYFETKEKALEALEKTSADTRRET